MHPVLKVFYSLLGVLPLASSDTLQLILHIYSWTLLIFLISLANYFESQFVFIWIKSGLNVITGCFSSVIDFLVYIPLICHMRKYCGNRAQCQQMVDIIRPTDISIVILTFIATAVIGGALTYYSLSLLGIMTAISRIQLYKAWIYVFLMYNCSIVILQFCAVLNSLAVRIKNLQCRINIHTATPSFLRFLDAVKLMSTAVTLHSSFLLLATLDMFCRSVHYCYILLWAHLDPTNMTPFIFYLPFAAIVAVKVMILYHLAGTCFRAKKSVKDFNYKLFDVVLKRWDLLQNEKLQLMVTRQNPVKFAPGGFFELGKRFMISMVNAIAVYLTVLVQVSHLKS